MSTHLDEALAAAKRLDEELFDDDCSPHFMGCEPDEDGKADPCTLCDLLYELQAAVDEQEARP